MLVLSRKEGESIVLAFSLFGIFLTEVHIRVSRLQGSRVSLGITAPKCVSIRREETHLVSRSPEMSYDPTESFRRSEVARINAEPGSREALEILHGQVWDTDQLQEDFNVEGFMAPYIVVRRKSDKAKGTLTFQHSPRFYFNFVTL